MMDFGLLIIRLIIGHSWVMVLKNYLVGSAVTV